MSNKFAPTTQKLLNAYPMWSAIRNDEQANGAQFLNTIGLSLDDLHQQLANINYNYTIPFANVTDIDVLYKFQLSKQFEFEVTNNDETNPLYAPPTVTGYNGSTQHPITLSVDNDIESFWYTAIPDRFTVTSVPVLNTALDDVSEIMYSALVNMTQDDSPFVANIVLDEPATRIWVQAVGGDKYIAIDDNKIVRRASVVITGITRKGIEESETVIFLHDDVVPTIKEWQSISKVEVYDINPSTTTVRLFAHRFRRNQTPILQPPRTFYTLYSSAESKQDMDTFWEIEQQGEDPPILKLQTWQVNDIRIRLNGFTDLDTIRSFELQNVEEVGLPVANDLCVEPFSNRVWVIDSAQLYVFDGDWTLPNMQLLDKKATAAISVMQPSTYHTTPNKTFDMEYFWRRQITDPVRHRVWVKLPDGSLMNFVGGAFTTYDPNEWFPNYPDSRFLRAKDTISLSDTGDYVFNMEVVYSNGTREIDQRIISVDKKIALAQYNFTTLINGGSLIGVDFDSDHNLWVLVDGGEDGIYKLKVRFYYDIMMIDYQNKTIFLKEEYDQIRVT